MDYNTLLNMTPINLAIWLEKEYASTLPSNIDSMEEMKKVNTQLSRLANSYSFVMQLLTYTKIQVRQEKRKGKENKENYEDMIDRRDTLQNTADILKMQYQTLSRMITVKKEINDELRMSSMM